MAIKKRYQETYIKGPVEAEFQRECASRYQAIKKVLKQFERPFSVFDLGANMGYFSVRIAEDFPTATVFAVDDKAQLPKIVTRNQLGNCYVIPKRLTADQLKRLADCEAFDVVLALNVFHHMPDHMNALAACRALGAILISETPGSDDRAAANAEKHAALDAALDGGFVLMDHTAHTGGNRKMRAERNWNDKTLRRQSIDAERFGYNLRHADDFKPGATRASTPMGKVSIFLDNAKARIKNERPGTRKPRPKGDVEERDFWAGMNLWNFALLGGSVPSKQEIAKRVSYTIGCADRRRLDDIRPWNFILHGEGCALIDQGFKLGHSQTKEEAVETCLAMLRKA